MSEILARPPVRPDDPLYYKQWALEFIGCPEAWAYTTGDDSVIVAVLDTGVDLDHPDLQGRLMQGTSFRAGDPNNTPVDYDGHGTWVTGIIGADTNTRLGVAGVTWKGRILPIKIHGQTTGDNAKQNLAIEVVQAAKGVQWAIENGAQILNISNGIRIPPERFWQGPADYKQRLYDALTEYKEAIDRAITVGCIVIAAAGQNIPPSYSVVPAAWEGVVAVGAIEPSGEHWQHSHTGSHIQFVAPGTHIWTTDRGGGYVPCDIPNHFGTSLAAPHVSGVAALVKACRPDLASNAILKIMRATATRVDQQIDATPDHKYGFGVVHAGRAVELALGT
jgi:thermitase